MSKMSENSVKTRDAWGTSLIKRGFWKNGCGRVSMYPTLTLQLRSSNKSTFV
jgi:hypothetical protein